MSASVSMRANVFPQFDAEELLMPQAPMELPRESISVPGEHPELAGLVAHRLAQYADEEGRDEVYEQNPQQWIALARLQALRDLERSESTQNAPVKVAV